MLEKKNDRLDLGKDSIVGVLKALGLTELESKVYIFLAKNGIHKASDISKKMDLHKAQVYHILKNLQNYGIVEATLESPMQFTAITFERVIDLLIKIKKGEVKLLEDQKNILIDIWSRIRIKNHECSTEKFSIIQGDSNIYSKFLQMIEDAQNEISIFLKNINGTRSDPCGIRILESIENKKTRVRLIIQISKGNLENMKIIKGDLLKHSSHQKFRLVEVDPQFLPFLIIKDNNDIFFGTSAKRVTHGEDIGLWTNSKSLICALKMLFDQLWINSHDIEKKFLLKSNVEADNPKVDSIIIN